MHVSPAKHSYTWLPRKCDYRTDTRTDRQKDRQTDLGQSDPYVPLCFGGDTKTTIIMIIHEKGKWFESVLWQYPFHQRKTKQIKRKYNFLKVWSFIRYLRRAFSVKMNLLHLPIHLVLFSRYPVGQSLQLWGLFNRTCSVAGRSIHVRPKLHGDREQPSKSCSQSSPVREYI